jgi:carboxyl-terminal processing protease
MNNLDKNNNLPDKKKKTRINLFLSHFLIFFIGLTFGLNITQNGTLPFGIKLPFFEIKQNKAEYKLINTVAPENKKRINFNNFWEVWDILEEDYYFKDDVDEEKMVEGSIRGMTDSLGDPYTMYLPKKANEISTQDLQGSFYGIGIELGYLERTLAVIAPLNGTPADKAGLKAGDLIIKVRDDKKKVDEETKDWSLEKAVETIRGQKGSEVILTIFRQNDEVHKEPFEVSIKRGEIIVKSVELEFAEKNGQNIAHLKLNKFGERTYQEWEEKVKEIKNKKNVVGIVFDLRNNPGGFFDEAIHVASDFIESGVIVSQESKAGKQDFYSKRTGRLKDYKLVVLVNKGSASASEIVAGALKDRKNTLLIGKKTFGKGTVQEKRSLNDGSGIHVTIAKWILPGGSWIHKEGLPVDIEVENNLETENVDEVLEKGIEELLKNDQ